MALTFTPNQPPEAPSVTLAALRQAQPVLRRAASDAATLAERLKAACAAAAVEAALSLEEPVR